MGGNGRECRGFLDYRVCFSVKLRERFFKKGAVMSIELPAELAEAAKVVATTKGFDTLADYIADVVRQDAEVFREEKPSNYQQTPEWRKRFLEWANSRPKVTHFVDTSRESIYGDRGF